MTIATSDDVAAWIGRPLTTLERGRVELMLRAVEVEIKRIAPDRLTNPEWQDAVIMVECSAAARAARLPDALSQIIPDTEATGPGFTSRLTQGTIQLYRSERRTLGLPNTGTAVGRPNPETEAGLLPGEFDFPWAWSDWGDCY